MPSSNGFVAAHPYKLKYSHTLFYSELLFHALILGICLVALSGYILLLGIIIHIIWLSYYFRYESLSLNWKRIKEIQILESEINLICYNQEENLLIPLDQLTFRLNRWFILFTIKNQGSRVLLPDHFVNSQEYACFRSKINDINYAG